jgi:hypothetical protein
VALDFPQDLAVDAAGRIFVADGDNHRIRTIDQGRMRTLAGGGTRTAGDGDARDVAIGQITRLAFDKAGNLLFNDVEGARVRRLWLQHGLSPASPRPSRLAYRSTPAFQGFPSPPRRHAMRASRSRAS